METKGVIGSTTAAHLGSGASQNIPRLAALDDLRAIAALLVLFAHIVHNLTHGVDPSLGSWIYPDNPIFAILAEGHAGVSLFLVLSGFLFGYGGYGADVAYLPFLRNRFLRIFPMYVLLLLLGGYTNLTQFTLSALATSLFLLSNTSGALDGGGFTVLLWTISVEFAFYLVFPFLNRFREKYGVMYLVHLLGLFIAIRFLCIGSGANARDFSYFTIFGRIDQFLIGMILAHLYASGVFRRRIPLFALGLVAAWILASLFAFNRMGGWIKVANWKGIWPTYEGLMFGALLVVYLLSHDRIYQPVRRVLSRIGMQSYSLYLIHMPILLALQKHKMFIKYFADPYTNAMVSAVLIVPLVLVASFVTFNLIERPFMSMRVVYLRPIVQRG